MEREVCCNCVYVRFLDDGVTCDFYCEKYDKWVFEDETCDEWCDEKDEDEIFEEMLIKCVNYIKKGLEVIDSGHPIGFEFNIKDKTYRIYCCNGDNTPQWKKEES